MAYSGKEEMRSCAFVATVADVATAVLRARRGRVPELISVAKTAKITVALQVAALSEQKALAVSRGMCSDCQEFFKKLAYYKEHAIAVADPDFIMVFKPDRTVVMIPH